MVTTLRGTATHQLAPGFIDHPYSGKTTYVFIRTSTAPADIGVMRVITDNIAAFVQTLKKRSGAGIWVVGGGQINTMMRNTGHVDAIIARYSL